MEALRCRLERLGATHVLYNTNNVQRFRTLPVEGYGEREIVADLERVRLLLLRGSSPVFQERGVLVGKLNPVDRAACPGDHEID